MNVAHTIRARSREGRRGEASTFKHFRRMLGYAWPHKRYLVPAVFCVLLMAVSYSAGIASILPALKVIVEPEGLHGWIDKTIAGERLKAQFAIYDSALNRPVEGIPEKTARVLSLKPNSPLASQGLRNDDFILAIDGEPVTALEAFAKLARPAESVALTVRGADAASTGETPAPQVRQLDVRLPELDSKWTVLRRVAGLIPGGTTPEERWRTLWVVLGLLLGNMVLGTVARVMAEYLTVVVTTRAIVDLRQRMLAHVLRLPLGYFSESTSDTVSKFVQDINEVHRGLVNFFQRVMA